VSEIDRDLLRVASRLDGAEALMSEQGKEFERFMSATDGVLQDLRRLKAENARLREELAAALARAKA
jgi:predicted nuclease with TOPRIM domain